MKTNKLKNINLFVEPKPESELTYADVPEAYRKRRNDNGYSQKEILESYRLHVHTERVKRNNTRISIEYDDVNFILRLRFGKQFKRPHFQFLFNILWRLLSAHEAVTGRYGKDYTEISINLRALADDKTLMLEG